MKIVIPIALALLLSACSQDNEKSAAKEKTTTEAVAQKTEVVEQKVEETAVKEKVVAEVKDVAVARTGQVLFAACSACHGADASKSALGKSQVIKGWDSAKIEAALNGYKDGSYGGAMKGIMKGQVSNLSADEIKSVSEYISKL